MTNQEVLDKLNEIQAELRAMSDWTEALMRLTDPLAAGRFTGFVDMAHDAAQMARIVLNDRVEHHGAKNDLSS